MSTKNLALDPESSLWQISLEKNQGRVWLGLWWREKIGKKTIKSLKIVRNNEWF